MTKIDLINQFHEVYKLDMSAARQLILKSNSYQKDHRMLQLIALSYVDEASFHSNGNEKEQYDRRKLRYAERYILKAFQLRPLCSNVLWTLAKVKKDYGQLDSAIFCYEEIIRLGIKGICRDNCQNSLDIARAQINDSKFELYRLYNKSNQRLSRLYLTLYKKGLRSGVFTLYKPYSKYLVKAPLGR